MLTQRGIYTDIKESTYTVEIEDFTFYFSSRLYKNKFIRIYQEEICRFNESANNVYKNKFSLSLDTLALIRLYALIEKRGFYIKMKERTIECLENVEFELVVKI